MQEATAENRGEQKTLTTWKTRLVRTVTDEIFKDMEKAAVQRKKRPLRSFKKADKFNDVEEATSKNLARPLRSITDRDAQRHRKTTFERKTRPVRTGISVELKKATVATRDLLRRGRTDQSEP